MAEAGTYRLKEGKTHFGPNGAMKPGDTIQLSASQAAAFGDKFERVGAPTKPSAAAASGVPAGTSGKAQDAGAKTPVGEKASNTDPTSNAEVTVGQPPAVKP